MKVAVIYDFALNKGGGDFVMLNILEALGNAGYEVSLFTSHPKGLHESAKFFDKPVPNVDAHHVKVPNFFRHPYTIAYIARKAAKIEDYAYDAYLVSDDIPKSIADRKGVCYLHYPHAARFKFREYIAIKYKTTIHGRLMWRVHETLFPRYFIADKRPKNWLLMANSIATRRHAAETFHVSAEEIALINPPVSAKRINEAWRNSSLKKENLVVCVGRFEIEKHFIEVLQALAHLKKNADVKLSLVGFACDEGHLVRTIKAYGLEEDVELLVNAERKVLVNRLLRAKAIVHPASHEPFGIAVVEAMAAGCIPIVRKGLNGPWLEITEKGKYGFGFNSPKEIVDVIRKVIKSYNNLNIKAIVERALKFDESEFRRKFIDLFENFMST